jgi:hypothetical protein
MKGYLIVDENHELSDSWDAMGCPNSKSSQSVLALHLDPTVRIWHPSMHGPLLGRSHGLGELDINLVVDFLLHRAPSSTIQLLFWRAREGGRGRRFLHIVYFTYPCKIEKRSW